MKCYIVVEILLLISQNICLILKISMVVMDMVPETRMGYTYCIFLCSQQSCNFTCLKQTFSHKNTSRSTAHLTEWNQTKIKYILWRSQLTNIQYTWATESEESITVQATCLWFSFVNKGRQVHLGTFKKENRNLMILQ